MPKRKSPGLFAQRRGLRFVAKSGKTATYATCCRSRNPLSIRTACIKNHTLSPALEMPWRISKLAAEHANEGAQTPISKIQRDRCHRLPIGQSSQRHLQQQPSAPLTEGQPGLVDKQARQRAGATIRPGRMLLQRADITGSSRQQIHNPEQASITGRREMDCATRGAADLICEHLHQPPPHPPYRVAVTVLMSPLDQGMQQRRYGKHFTGVRHPRRPLRREEQTVQRDLPRETHFMLEQRRQPYRLPRRHNPAPLRADNLHHPSTGIDQLPSGMCMWRRANRCFDLHPQGQHRRRTVVTKTKLNAWQLLDSHWPYAGRTTVPPIGT